MDPISLLVTALVTGAAAALKPTAEQAVKDAYDGLKGLIKRKYSTVNVEQLEQKPESTSRQGVVKEELESTEAAKDREVLQHAQTVLQAVEKHAPEAAAAVGVNLKDINAASLRLDDIVSSGTGVSVERSAFTGDINISKVRAGQQGTSDPNP